MWFALPTIACNFFSGPCAATVQSVAPSSMKAKARSIENLVVGLMSNLGPFVIGSLSDSYYDKVHTA